MKEHFKNVNHMLKRTRNTLLKDPVLMEDLDTNPNLNSVFLPPYSTAQSTDDVKLIFIGQDPTVEREESREKITATLNLDKRNSLWKYVKNICDGLNIDLDKEVYATNLYKCFFVNPPAKDTRILTRHFKTWIDVLAYELKAFDNPVIITLGEPLIEQLIHAHYKNNNNKKVRYYWDYTGSTTSGLDFKCVEAEDNYLCRRFYAMPHQPTGTRNPFYKKYFDEWVRWMRKEEEQI